MTSPRRYAVYWVPARAHPLWEAGCTWLGRDPEQEGRHFSVVPFTVTPRRYGFHATLKAPMRLVDGTPEEAFVAAVRRIASTPAPIAIPALEVRAMADFIALRSAGGSVEDETLRALAARCVVELDGFRAPFDEAEWAVRVNGLDAEERDLTSRFGYHFVLHRWRFHLTLSDSFPPGASRGRDDLKEAARVHFSDALAAPIGEGDIAIFVEPEGSGPFVLAHRFPIERDRGMKVP